MSNKLAKHQKQKERLTGKQKKVLFWSCFVALSIAFLAVWLNVFLTSNALDGGKTNEYNKRMQVPESVYTEYEVGDTITAYTTDHIKYSYNKVGILPDKKFRNNELMKVAGVVLGAAIGFLSLWGLLNRKIS